MEDFDEPIDEGTTRLTDVLRPRSKFVYQYDFGDSWEHLIVVEKLSEDTEIVNPVCIAGARACPPEDSGGPWGYAAKLEALANPEDDDEERDHWREWMGDFDPERFDMDRVNKQLKRAFQPVRRKKVYSVRNESS
jgi:hypothetical protein